MKTLDFKPEEIATGFTFLHTMHGVTETLTVRDVVFRLGRGLYFETERHDGTLGPTIYPNMDNVVKVVGTVPVEEVPSWVPTSDYPHARVMR